jgi:hypothetical protein
MEKLGDDKDINLLKNDVRKEMDDLCYMISAADIINA